MIERDEERGRLRERLGRWGIWTFELDRMRSPEEAAFASAVEAAGFSALWIAEGTASKEALSHAALLLGATARLRVATGIANIRARDATAMASAARTLDEAHPDRFVLGMGVSHSVALARRGHEYGRPLALMRSYLEEMAATPLSCPEPAAPSLRVIAALRPRMLELAAELAHGAHTYFVPPEHTARARDTLGPAPVLAPEVAVVLEADPDRARTIARTHTEHYLARDSYRKNLLTLGFTTDDLEAGGSDRLVDAVVAWGDDERVAARVGDHVAAGADHVAVQLLGPTGGPAAALGRLAAALGVGS